MQPVRACECERRTRTRVCLLAIAFVDFRVSSCVCENACPPLGSRRDFFFSVPVLASPPPCIVNHSASSIRASALARAGIEVGPLPHGTLSYPLLAETRALVCAALDAIETRNAALLAMLPPGADITNVRIVTPENSAWRPPAAGAAFPQQKVFVQVATLPFPAADTASATAAAAVAAPSEAGAAAAPLQAYCVHPSLEGPNFRPLPVGAPLFIASDGSGTTLPFVHPAPSSSVGTPPAEVYTMCAYAASSARHMHGLRARPKDRPKDADACSPCPLRSAGRSHEISPASLHIPALQLSTSPRTGSATLRSQCIKKRKRRSSSPPCLPRWK